MENPAVNSPVSAISADPAKWRALLNEFESVLKINIFMIDPQGSLIVPSYFEENQQGGGLPFGRSLIKATFGISFPSKEDKNVLQGSGEFLDRFDPVGPYLQLVDPFDLRLFAIPVKGADEKILFYLIIGPLRVGKQWAAEKYMALAQSLGLSVENLLSNIQSVPEMSQAVLNAVLDLLSEIAKDVYELSLEKEKFSQLKNQDEVVRPEIFDTAQELLSDIQNDELLISILDSAIKMAGAEGGSIMIYDEDKKDFAIKVSRGLDHKKNIVQARFKMGEGIAGIAAQEKIPFVISGTEGDARIRHLLKRPDIAQSFVVPILFNEKVIGVLNLSVKDPDKAVAVSGVQKDIQKFSPLIASALRCL